MISKKRSYKTRGLSGILQPTLEPIRKQRGFATDIILREWPNIIGAELAAMCVPQKMNLREGHGGSLTVWCDPAFATELHYQLPLIIEKIASYLGYRAVEKITIQQHSFEPPEELVNLDHLPLTPEQKEEVSKATKQAEDEDIRNSLQRIAAARLKRKQLVGE